MVVDLLTAIDTAIKMNERSLRKAGVVEQAVLDRTGLTIPAAVEFWADAAPGAPALTHGDELVSYGNLARRVRVAAARLQRLGVERGARVVLVGDNSIDWVVAYLAVLRLGAVIAPSNNRLNVEQFAQQCRLLGAVLVLHDSQHLETAQAAGSPQCSILHLADLCAHSDVQPEPDVDLPAATDLALISFTSGTTGVPKGAMLSQAALAMGSQVFKDLVRSGPEDSTLVLVPLFHNTGFVDQLGHMILAGGRTDLLTRFKTQSAVAQFANRPVTFVTAVPSILRLLMVAEGADAVYAPAGVVLFGGSPMPAAWTHELLDRWPHLRLLHGYGLTEFTSACTFLPEQLIGTKGESVGRPVPGVSLKVVDEEGRSLPADTDGEVWVAGPTCMSGYWGEPELTAAKLRGDWLCTGDLGHLDTDGLLWLSGRVDDVINRGGEKVLPAHVESCIAELPAVADAAVFGYHDPILQNRVAAGIELRPGQSFDEVAARSELLRLLPDYAVPELWLLHESLPRTASGKVDRRAVAHHYKQATSSQGES